MKSVHIEGHSAFAPVCIIQYSACPIHPASSHICIKQSDSIDLSGNKFLDEIDQLLPVAPSWVRSLELNAGCLVIVAV